MSQLVASLMWLIGENPKMSFITQTYERQTLGKEGPAGSNDHPGHIGPSLSVPILLQVSLFLFLASGLKL